MRPVLFVSCAVALAALVACDKGTDPNDPYINDPNAIKTLNLQIGMWWTQTVRDTTHSTADSAGTKKTSVSPKLHHTYNKVAGISQGGNGEVLYTIAISDTLIDPLTGNAVSHSDSSTVLKLKDNKVQYALTFDTTGFSDSIAITYLDLPVATGKIWTVAELDLDSTFHYSYLNIPLRMRAVGQASGTASTDAVASAALGTTNLVYFPIASTMNGSAAAIIDTTISALGTNFVTKGDTAFYTTLKVTSRTDLCTRFTIPLRTQRTSILYISSKFTRQVQRDTVKSLSVLTSVFDPATNAVISQ